MIAICLVKRRTSAVEASQFLGALVSGPPARLAVVLRFWHEGRIGIGVVLGHGIPGPIDSQSVQAGKNLVFPGDGSYLMMSSSLLIGANSEAVILASAAILHKTRQECSLHEMLIGTALSSLASFQVGSDTFETNCNYCTSQSRLIEKMKADESHG